MPVVDMCSEKKDEYIADNRSKLMKWDDYFYTQLLDLQPSQTINYNITNSVYGIKGIVAIPIMNAKTHGLAGAKSNNGNVVDNAIAFSPLLSPFTGEGRCTSPLGISGFNVQLSGENQLTNFVSYDFEMFQSQVHLQNAINGTFI
jgi:hypothetical protein